MGTKNFEFDLIVGITKAFFGELKVQQSLMKNSFLL